MPKFKYYCEKGYFKEGTREHKEMTLSSANKDFKDIVLKKLSEEEFEVIAEFVQVLH